jgi:uncharacterized surface protein with fasciclin (FAS1) repeats
MKLFRSLAVVALLAAPATAVAQEAQGYAPAAAPAGDIIETATRAGSFTTLAKALEAAGLVETLKGEGPFTVFAPTDEAFAKLPKGTLDALLKDKKKLTAILTYHVVPGKVGSEQVATLKSAKTVNGKELTIATTGGNVTVGNATVIQADIPATNGVIHVIDSVLLPE